MRPTRDDRDDDWEIPPEPPVHGAARRGDIAELTHLLRAGADINQRADVEIDNGPHLRALTPLMTAARSIDGASTETLIWLVEHGADLHARSEGEDTAAWYAAGHGGRWEFHPRAVTPDHANRLRYLLEQGLDPNECNFIGRSLLSEAAAAGDPARLRVLFEMGATLRKAGPTKYVPDLATQVLDSAGQAHPSRFALIGDRSVDAIPLHCAARSGSVECVRMLLAAGADIDERCHLGSTALMVAGSAAAATLLLERGIDLHTTN